MLSPPKRLILHANLSISVFILFGSLDVMYEVRDVFVYGPYLLKPVQVQPDIYSDKHNSMLHFVSLIQYVLIQVAEALQSSKRVMQENQINIEEVEQCLLELDENIDALKRIDNALGKHSLSDL